MDRPTSDLRFGRFRLEPAQRQLLVDGQPAALGARAFDLLLALVERRDRVVGKAELLDLVWPGLIVEENNLQVQISTLRKLLGPQAIATIPGRGYRFTLRDRNAAPVSAAEPLATPSPAAGNLPTHPPSLIGRDPVLAKLLTAIEAHALVTVVGAGGIGKTVLAQTAAVALRGRYRDGAWWVELAPLSDPAQLLQTIAQALRITLGGNGTAQEQLVSLLRSHELLLVLDNCEHLIDAVSRLAESIGTEAPSVRLLATSQELLNVPEEHVFRLDPLAVPAEGEALHMETYGAVALFVERARAADPRFAFGPENAAVVADICRHLDGLPLAIELAAARVRLLGAHGLRERLGERFKVLTGGARTAMRRHQTLHAALDWSHSLLARDEQTVFRRFGVFVGGFSLTLAQDVCADDRLDEWAVLDALGTLVDKSLVAVDLGEPVRYRLLETTRAYALERLADAGETARLLQRHAHAVRDLFVRTDDERFADDGTLDMESLMRRLAPEIDNWRAALDWASGDGAEPMTAIALAGVGAMVLRELGLTQEGLNRLLSLRALVNNDVEPRHAAAYWLRLALLGWNGRLPREVLLDAAARPGPLYAAAGSRRRRVVGLCHAARSLTEVGDHHAAEEMLSQIIRFEAPDDPAWLRSLRLNLQGIIYGHQGRFEEAASLHAAARALLLQAPGEEAGLASCENNLCVVLNCLQRHDEVIEIVRAALQRHHSSGVEGFLRFRLLHSQLALRRFADAWHTLREGLLVWRRDALLMHGCFLFAALLAASGRHVDAARLDGAGISDVRRSGAQILPVQQLSRDRMFRAFEAAGVVGADIERWQREGEAFDDAQVAALCEAAAKSN